MRLHKLFISTFALTTSLSSMGVAGETSPEACTNSLFKTFSIEGREEGRVIHRKLEGQMLNGKSCRVEFIYRPSSIITGLVEVTVLDPSKISDGQIDVDGAFAFRYSPVDSHFEMKSCELSERSAKMLSVFEDDEMYSSKVRSEIDLKVEQGSLEVTVNNVSFFGSRSGLTCVVRK